MTAKDAQRLRPFIDLLSDVLAPKIAVALKNEQLVSVRELCNHFDISRMTLYRVLGHFPGSVTTEMRGNKRYFSVPEFEEMYQRYNQILTEKDGTKNTLNRKNENNLKM